MPKNEDILPFPPTPKAVHEYISHKQKHSSLFENVKAEFNAILKSLSESFSGLEKHEVHAIVSDKSHRPHYKALGLYHVTDEVENELDANYKQPAKRGPKPKATAKPSTKKSGKAGGKTKPKVKRIETSKVKPEDILKFIGSGKKNTSQIKEKFGQLITKKLNQLEKSKKLITVKEGAAKIWKKV